MLIKEKFGVEYKKSRLYELLKELGLKLSKPYIFDVKRPGNAEEILGGKTGRSFKNIEESGIRAGRHHYRVP